MRISGAFVEMAACPLASLVSKHLHRCVIGRALVGDYDFGVSTAFHGFSEKLQRLSLVPLLRDVGFEHFPLVIHRAPEVPLPADLHQNFVEMPAPSVNLAHRLGPPLTDLICEVCPDAIYPKANALVTNVYAPFTQKSSTFPNESGNRTYNNTPS